MEIREKTNLQFDDDFFKEEIRCDYLVTEKTKKIWAVEIDLLNELIRVCKKHNIKMCVSCGTLLGAIRHKGMIPWDDDIDVSLTREEYDRLCKVAPQEFDYPYFFQNYKTDSQYLFGYSRLRNSLSTGYIVGCDASNYNNGIYIDVFVMDGYTEDESLLIKQLRRKRQLERFADLYNGNVFSKNPFKRFIKELLISFISPILHRVIKYDSITEAYEKNLQRYDNATTRVSLMTHNSDLIKKYWCDKKDLLEITYIPFENIMVPAPVRYDAMLTQTYGNYMEFPPVNKRGAWHEGILVFDPDTPYQEFMKKKKYLRK